MLSVMSANILPSLLLLLVAYLVANHNGGGSGVGVNCQNSSNNSFAANASLVYGDIDSNVTLMCLNDTSILGALGNLSWLETPDFVNLYTIDNVPGSYTFDNISNELTIWNFNVNLEGYYLCGVEFTNGSFKVLNTFQLVARCSYIQPAAII
jgi:hypothetical protein